MAVYSLPKEFENEVPSFQAGKSYDEFVQAEADFLARLIAWAKKRSGAVDEYAGTVIRWPYADGYAQYLVAASEPVQLIYLPLGDGWDFPLAERATKEDIISFVAREKAWADLVASQKNKV